MEVEEIKLPSGHSVVVSIDAIKNYEDPSTNKDKPFEIISRFLSKVLVKVGTREWDKTPNLLKKLYFEKLLVEDSHYILNRVCVIAALKS